MLPNEEKPDDKPKTYGETFGALQRAMIEALKEKEEGPSDLARSRVTIPDHIHPSIVGSAICGLARDGLIEQVGTTVTERPVAHGRLTRIWRLTDSDRPQNTKNESGTR